LEQKKLEEQAAAGPRPTNNGVVTAPVVSGFKGPQ
jgi:hypothetical protein